MDAIALVSLICLSGSDLPPIVPEAVPLEEPGRYRSPRSCDETLEFYERHFRRAGGVRFRDIVNAPGVKARHIQNLRRNISWDGINIYEIKGEVGLSILPKREKKAGKTIAK